MDTENTNTDTTVETETQTNPDTTTPEAAPTSGMPEYTPQAFAELNAAYALGAPAEPNETEQAAEQREHTEAGADYTLTFPDSFADHPEAAAFNSILAPIAQQSGMDGEQFGKVFADAYTAITHAQQRAEWQNRFQQDVDLKKDWGADYETNMATARSHISFLKERAGLTDDDLAVFASPKGMRALYAMATAHATPPAAGLDTNSISDQTWAKAVMTPDHPDHDAFTNPMHPRYKEINQRWLRANGQ